MLMSSLRVSPSCVDSTLIGLVTDASLDQLLPRIRTLRHNDDNFHSGETILEHTVWVLEDLERLAYYETQEKKHLLSLAALFHDLGKAYTHTVEDGANKYRGHAEASLEVYDALLARYDDDEVKLRVRDLVRLHDVFLGLAKARKLADGLDYLQGFMHGPLVVRGDLDLLIMLAYADSARAKPESVSFQSLMQVIQDIEKCRVKALL